MIYLLPGSAENTENQKLKPTISSQTTRQQTTIHLLGSCLQTTVQKKTQKKDNRKLENPIRNTNRSTKRMKREDTNLPNSDNEYAACLSLALPHALDNHTHVIFDFTSLCRRNRPKRTYYTFCPHSLYS